MVCDKQQQHNTSRGMAPTGNDEPSLAALSLDEGLALATTFAFALIQLYDCSHVSVAWRQEMLASTLAWECDRFLAALGTEPGSASSLLALQRHNSSARSLSMR